MSSRTSLNALPTNANTWTCATNTSWRRINNGSTLGQHYCEFILSEKRFVSADARFLIDASSGTGSYEFQIGLGINSTTVDSANQTNGSNSSETRFPFAKLAAGVDAGKITLNILEQNDSSTRAVQVFGDGPGGWVSSGVMVEVNL